MLRMRLSPETTPTEPVFANTKLSWRDLGQAGKWIRQALDAAGYPWLTSHVFRKTAATVLDEQRFLRPGDRRSARALPAVAYPGRLHAPGRGEAGCGLR